MYKITLQKYNSSDIYTLHDPRTDDLLLMNPKLKLELNKTGTLTFSVPVTHPYYSQIAKMQCEITVYRDESIIYVGRPLTSEDDFYKTSAVTCEGILAYLIDSTQRPYEHQGNIYDFFNGVLTNHNNSVDEFKRFTLGVCDVTDSNNYINRSDSGYTDSLTTINEKLIDTHGGYLSVRYEGGKRYLDYKSQAGKENKQIIQFGNNLIDLSKYIKSDNLITAVIPLGAETEEEGINGTKKRVTIESVNDGKDYLVDSAAVAQYGLIYGVVEFDDVTLPSNLKTKAQKYLDDNKNLSLTIELSAVDLSMLDTDIEEFNLGDMIRVVSAPHDLDQYFLLSSYDIDIVNPANNKITLGKTLSKLTATVNKNQNDATISLIKKTEALNTDISNAVENATQLITGAHGGYLYFKSNSGGQPEELYILDAPSIEDAQNVIRLNKNGIGFSRTGYSGEFANAWTIDGSLVADFITTGTLNAALIKAGIIRGSENSNCYFDLNNDELSASQMKSSLTDLYMKFAYMWDATIGSFDGLGFFRTGDDYFLGGIGHNTYNSSNQIDVNGGLIGELRLRNSVRHQPETDLVLNTSGTTFKTPTVQAKAKSYTFLRSYSENYAGKTDEALSLTDTATVISRISNPDLSNPRISSLTLRCPEDASDSDTLAVISCQFVGMGGAHTNSITIKSDGIYIQTGIGGVKINGMDVVAEINALKEKVS